MDKMNNVLLIDGHNFLHRCWVGFSTPGVQSDYTICFTFFRNLRSLIEKQKASSVHIVLEGHPVKRVEEFEDYKGNRKRPDLEEIEQLKDVDVDAYNKALKHHHNMKSFFRQKEEIISLIKQAFPIVVNRHANHEADDVIYNLIKHDDRNKNFTVVSNDTDFHQLLCEFDNVKVFNPHKKSYVEKPSYDYVSWKALRGDGSDNISGILGVGDKRATKIMSSDESLQAYLSQNPVAKEIFERNVRLIKFHDFSDDELSEVESSTPIFQPNVILEKFNEWEFASITKSFGKFTKTFADLVNN